MKNVKSLAIGLAIMTGLFSCQKEQLLEQLTLQNNESAKGEIQASYKQAQNQDIYLRNGLLVFKDMDVLKLTLESLEQQVTDLDESFISTYENLSEEAINAKEYKLGFDELKPLKDFERVYGFNSLRKKIEREEEQWLNNPNLDESSDPDDHIIVDIYVRTILNEQAEVMAGSSIYKFLDDGSYYEITDGSFETLKQINDGEDATKLSNVIRHNTQKAASGCKTNKWDSGYKKSGNYRIKWKVGIYNYPWQCGMKSKVTSYKKRGRRWKKYRTYLKVGIEGRYCLSNGSLSSSTGWVYSDRYNKKSWSWKITGPCQTKSGKVHGYHYGNSISYSSTLTF